jgi:ATP-dependent DNA helicase RecQ
VSKSHDILKKYWGFDSFRPLQQDIVESAIYGHDTLALLPTGGGKSICFQVPGLAREGVCLVISPLIALMEDQVLNLRKKGIKAELIVNGMTYKEIDIILDNVRFGQVKFLYTSPERLKTKLFQERFKLMHVGLIAIDEAHCISQWGFDFRPSYLDIDKLRQVHPDAPIIAVTATATEQVKEDIIDNLGLKNHRYFEGNFERKNLSYEVYRVEQKEQAVLRTIQKFSPYCGIVYCQTRKSTKHIAQLLLANGIQAGFYHGGMTREERSQKQQLWLDGKIKVIVATNAFGMGIDKPDVRYVLHYEFPDSLEAYYQEAGRAGRDGLPSRTMAFFDEKDIPLLEKKVTDRFPPAEEVKRIYRAICNFLQLAIGSGKDESFDFDINAFIQRYNLDVLTVFNSLKILELNETLAFSENALQSTRMKLVVSNTQVYNFQVKHANYDPLISMICRTHPGIFEQFVELDERGLMNKLKIPKTTLHQQLKFIEQHGLAEFNWTSNAPKVTFLHERLPDDYLTIAPSVLKVRKEVAMEKLAFVKDFLTKPECRSIQLVRYFGQATTPCGYCDYCRSLKKKEFTPEELKGLVLSHTVQPITFEELKQITGSRHAEATKKILLELVDQGELRVEDERFVRN